MADFEKIEEYILNDEKNDIAIKKDKTFRRYFFTWNNPFWENQFEEVDIETTQLPKNFDKYDLYYFQQEHLKDLFIFKNIKYTNSKTKIDEVVTRAFFKDDTSIKSYLLDLSNLRYFAFQIEKGGNSDLTHIQGFIQFKNPINWSTMIRRFPFADLSDVYSNSVSARAYVTKDDTRVRGPYEFGEFVEERSRKDIEEFMRLIDEGATKQQLKQVSPNLYIREFNKLDRLREETIFENFRYSQRNVEVTYIYGPPSSGKTSYVVNEYGFKDAFWLDLYDNAAFTCYSGQDTLVLDEFTGLFTIPFMNKILDKNPLQLRGLGVVKWACWSKVIIISNFSPEELYSNSEHVLRQAFFRRIHNIMKFDIKFNYKYERQYGQKVYDKTILYEEPIEIDNPGKLLF